MDSRRKVSMGIPKNIQLTGIVYIKYIDSIIKAQIGDIMLLLHNDAISAIVGDYENVKVSGYIKSKVYDGLVWQNINITEFCSSKEYKFTKKQHALGAAKLCKEIIAQYRGGLLQKTYRGHFSMNSVVT